MKTILLAISLCVSCFLRANNHSNASTEALLAQEIKERIQYPALKLSYMDPLQARVYFIITEQQEVVVVKVSSSNVELKEQLNLALQVKPVDKVNSTERVYSVMVKFK